jgi:type I restriction enzyme S subunit
MKTNWQTKKLGEVCSVGAGNSAPQRKDFFVDGKYPFFRTSDIGQIHIGNVIESFDYLNEKGIKGLKLFQKGTILIPKSGASTFLNHRVIMGVDGYVSSHLATIKTDEKILNNIFLFYFLQEIKAQDLIQDHKYPSLNLPVIANIEIPIPSLLEQKRIVKTLDETFKRIQKAKENTKKNLKNSIYLESIFLNKDNSWKEKMLGEICDTGAGGTPLKAHRDYYENGNIPWLRSGEVCQKEITKSELFITEKGFKNSSAKMFPKNTVLVAMYGATAGQTGILRFESTTNQAVCGILPNDNFLPEYIYYYFSARKADLVKQAVGGAQPNISQIKIKNTFVPILSIFEQKSIVKKLNELSEKAKKLEEIYKQKLIDLEELKKSVLKKAFTGQL